MDYSPTVVGTSTDSIVFSYVDGLNPQNLNFSVQGDAQTPAFLTISEAPTFDFGIFALGSSTDATFTITNTGQTTATTMANNPINAPFGYKGTFYPGSGGTCSSQLNSLESCIIIVEFSPVGTPASYSELLRCLLYTSPSPRDRG